MLLDAVSIVSKEIAKVESVEKIAIIRSLAKNAKKLMELEDLAAMMPIEKGDYWLHDNPALATEIHEEELLHARKYRAKQIKDVDLAIWVSNTNQFGLIRRALSAGINEFISRGKYGVSNNEFDIFLIDSESNKFLGNLCRYATCPKGKDDCSVRGCGKVPHLQKFKQFTFFPDAANQDKRIDIYDKPGSAYVEAEFDLNSLLQVEEKDDLITLIASIFKKSEVMKRHILHWLATMEKKHLKARNTDSG